MPCAVAPVPSSRKWEESPSFALPDKSFPSLPFPSLC
ncbi:hypothetical protein VDGL01_08177 [Verticillium dahliae]